jgi:hypothetical protein
MHQRTINVRTVGAVVCSAALALLLPTTTATTASAAAGGAKSGDGIGTAKFTELPASAQVKDSAVTIPHWSSTFTDPTNGQTYRYTMVGTDPGAGNATTTVPTVIIPMNFTFDQSADPAVHSLDGADRVADTISSPVFQNANIGAAADATASAPPSQPGVAPSPRVVNEPSDVTQLGDAIYRAQFGKSSSGWHVRLGQPTVLAPASFNVPKNQGQIVVGSRTHADIGLMSYSWFTTRLESLLASRHISPTVLPIFLVNNVFLYVHSQDNCCVLGYHGALTSLNGQGRQRVNTFMFASYSQQGIFAANPGDTQSYIADVHGLSHEVQEWYDDPFINNVVDPWLTPTAPQYGCTALLETGDPVVGFGFEVAMPNGITYHPEDEVHFSWFARESPSRAAQGYYTYLNNFAGVAQGC